MKQDSPKISTEFQLVRRFNISAVLVKEGYNFAKEAKWTEVSSLVSAVLMRFNNVSFRVVWWLSIFYRLLSLLHYVSLALKPTQKSWYCFRESKGSGWLTISLVAVKTKFCDLLSELKVTKITQETTNHKRCKLFSKTKITFSEDKI